MLQDRCCKKMPGLRERPPGPDQSGLARTTTLLISFTQKPLQPCRLTELGSPRAQNFDFPILQGETKTVARAAIVSAAKLFIVRCYERDILHTVLRDRGMTRARWEEIEKISTDGE